jgi:molecular chaperone HtpG
MSSVSGAETHGFRAEVKQLLHLVIHSLYSNREIFLRELISNASDANDRLRFAALADPALLEGDPELGIELVIDAEQGTLSVSDNGIGMSHEEIIENLGTIARSGTGEFLSRLSGDQKKDSQLIGQFGVGFYSAFTVAGEVEVVSRRAALPADQAVRWVSNGETDYTLSATERSRRGTTVILRLRPEAREYLDEHRVRDLVRRYSDHIAFPVTLINAARKDAAPETVNKARALWTRSRADITDEEYQEFYRHIAHDQTEPLVWSHNHVEGKREYISLIFVPSRAPLDLWNREHPRGLKLYVNRVFVTDDAVQFLPLYLRFVRGVIDSSDLALNVSRELLQQDANVAAIRNALTKRVLDMLERLALEEPEKYATFWGQFGTVLKEGIAEDLPNKGRIATLLRFASTRTSGTEQTRSLKDYSQQADSEQKAVYFLTAESLTAARSSPHLELFRKLDMEVLLLVDRIDEWVVRHLDEHDGKPLRDVTRGTLEPELTGCGAAGAAELSKDHRHLLNRAKRALGERIDEVRASRRLTDSAACLVFGEEDLGYRMQELLKVAGHAPSAAVPSLELNLDHPLVLRLVHEGDDARFEQLVLLLLDQAILAEGQPLEDPGAFVGRLNRLLLQLTAQGSETAPNG